MFKSTLVLQRATGVLILKIFSAGIGFLLNMVLARFLGPLQYGVYSLLLVIVNFSVVFASLGLVPLLIREVATYKARRQWSFLKGIIVTGFQWSFLGSLIAAIIFMLFALRKFISEVEPSALFMLFVLIPITVLGQIRAAVLRGLNCVIFADIPELVLRPFLALIAVLFVSSIQSTLTVNRVVTIQFVVAILALWIGTRLLKKFLPLEAKNSTIETDYSYWIRAAIPFFIVSLLSIAEGQISLLFVGYLGAAEQAGRFQVSTQIVGVIALGLTAINLSLQPKLAAAWAKNEYKQAQHMISEATLIGSVFALFVSIVLIINAPQLLAIAGESFMTSADCLRILAMGQMVNALSGSCGVVLSMTGHQRIAGVGLLAAILTNALVCFYLIPRYGEIGSAWGTVTGMTVWNFFHSYLAWRQTGLVTPFIGSFIKK
ncbi:putative Flippase [Gammaproteobacteria bacterium]